MLKAKVTERDRGLKRLQLGLEKLSKDRPKIKVGVIDDGTSPEGTDQREGGITNAELMAVHEFGSRDGRIPERAPMRTSFAKNGPKYIEMMRVGLATVDRGELEIFRAMNLIGSVMASDIKATIIAGLKPENAESTKKAKGSDTPLVDTGQLLNSITHAVLTKAGKVASRGKG